jgi:cardiolipin synthase
MLVAAVGILAALHALLTKRDSRSAFGWIGFCLILPVVGPLIYVLFGINRLNERAHRTYISKLEADSTPSILAPAGTSLRPLSTVGERVTGKGLRACTSVDVLTNGEELYPAMLDAFAGATDKIYLSSYLFDNDTTGERFIEALCAAQARGVDVRIIIDALGEYMSLPRIGRKLRRCGLNFVRFNPITLIPPSLHINMRNHRKITIVDSRVAFTGGQNIGDRHLVNRPSGHRVQDLHFRLTGKVVDELERAFLHDWYYCIGRKKTEPFKPSNENLTESDIWTRVVMDGPNEYIDRLNDLIVGVTSTATRRVWIMTPYFLPGSDIVSALVGARLRGVDVKILLPSENNIFLVHWAMQNNLLYFMEKDIEIYFQPGPFVHTKILLIDDIYSLVGSANWDARSLRLNFELGLEVFDRGLNRHLATHFQNSLARATRVTSEQLAASTLPLRIRNALAWLFSPYL